MVDLTVKLCNSSLKNPVILASGIWGVTPETLVRASEYCGAVTIKSIGPKRREGNPNPAVVANEHYVHNAVGLPSSGIDDMDNKWEALKELKSPLIASCYGDTAEDYVNITEKIVPHKPALLELNISCPNKAKGMLFAQDPIETAKLVKAVKKVSGRIPISVKLTPNVTNIVEIAKAAEKSGADCITAINTVSGMLINPEARKPVLGFKCGGISGPAIKPIALKCVYDIYENVKIPIIGTGGVNTGRDAIEMIMAGASAVGVGSAVYYRGNDFLKLIVDEMKKWMLKNNVKSIPEIRGVAHE
ncbi:dihydroorotate dehydrogenase [Nanoarchaeota archaeon]